MDSIFGLIDDNEISDEQMDEMISQFAVQDQLRVLDLKVLDLEKEHEYKRFTFFL